MANGFEKLIPGFDFLQGLSKQSGNETQGSPTQASHFGHWVTPTFNVEELEKRIADLKAVQFWLDQNALALKTTIQALEVQKMTLATLKGMNLNMADIANGLKTNAANTTKTATEADNNGAGANIIDPTAWWGALAQQFQHIAMNTVQETNKKSESNPTQKVVSKRVRKVASGTTETGTKTPRKAPIRKRS